MRSSVAVVRVRSESILADIDRLADLGGMSLALDKGAPTIIKDQLTNHHPLPAANTTPWQLEGAIVALRERQFDELVCVENNLLTVDAKRGLDFNHYLALHRQYDIPVRYTHKPDDMRWIHYRPRTRMRALDKVFRDGFLVPDFFVGKNIVHLPTMNCDPSIKVSGAMMNASRGLLRDNRYHRHPLFSQMKVDLLAVQKELHSGVFAIVDGTTAGNCVAGESVLPVVKNFMLASADQVAIDAVVAKMMGFDPMTLEFIALAHNDRLGVGDPRDIDIVGDDISIENWRFQSEHSATPGARLKATLERGARGPLGGLLLRSPLGSPLARVLSAASDAYGDFYRWPLKDKRIFEEWRATTEWGRLFEEYALRTGYEPQGTPSLRPGFSTRP